SQVKITGRSLDFEVKYEDIVYALKAEATDSTLIKWKLKSAAATYTLGIYSFKYSVDTTTGQSEIAATVTFGKLATITTTIDLDNPDEAVKIKAALNLGEVEIKANAEATGKEFKVSSIGIGFTTPPMVEFKTDYFVASVGITSI